MIRISGCAGELVGQGEAHILKDIGEGRAQLGQGERETLLQKVLKELVKEQDLVEVEGLL